MMSNQPTNAELANVPAGWQQLIRDCIQELTKIEPDCRLLDAREKLGVLSITISTEMPLAAQALDEVRSKYERFARSVCQFCGAPGEQGARSVRCRDCVREVTHER
jgi:hypothetical protein